MIRAHTVLAFDFGLKRIGIASGDTLTRQAAPRPAASVGRTGPDWERIAREVRALAPELLVVGAPYNAAGGEGELSAAVRAFAAELERRFTLPVALVDERFSSLEAGAAPEERRASGERRWRIGGADLHSARAAGVLARRFSGEGEVGRRDRRGA